MFAKVNSFLDLFYYPVLCKQIKQALFLVFIVKRSTEENKAQVKTDKYNLMLRLEHRSG